MNNWDSILRSSKTMKPKEVKTDFKFLYAIVLGANGQLNPLPYLINKWFTLLRQLALDWSLNPAATNTTGSEKKVAVKFFCTLPPDKNL